MGHRISSVPQVVTPTASLGAEYESQGRVDGPHLTEREVPDSFAEAGGIDGAGLFGEHQRLRAVDVGATSHVESTSKSSAWTTTAYRRTCCS
jgi:hypothetical protein